MTFIRLRSVALAGGLAFLAGCAAPVDVVVLVDGSASSATYRSGYRDMLGRLVARLDPQADSLSVYEVNAEFAKIYEGQPSPGLLKPVLDRYLEIEPEAYGTPYLPCVRAGREKLQNRLRFHGREAQARGALIVMGDLADEAPKSGKPIPFTPTTLAEEARQLPPEAMLALLYGEAHRLTDLGGPLSGLLGPERYLDANPEVAGHPATLDAICRFIGR
jgi:hypothetical protein